MTQIVEAAGRHGAHHQEASGPGPLAETRVTEDSARWIWDEMQAGQWPCAIKPSKDPN
jgi:hypothetical protein